jgi:hypothetical protein
MMDNGYEYETSFFQVDIRMALFVYWIPYLTTSLTKGHWPNLINVSQKRETNVSYPELKA